MDFIEYLRRNAFDSAAPAAPQAPSALQGWMCQNFEAVFTDMIKDKKDPLTIIEVGTWKGLSAKTMADICKKQNVPVKIVCVDTWLGAPEFWTWGLHDPTRGGSLNFKNGFPQVYYTFLSNMIAHGHQDVIAPFPISSTEAVHVFNHYNIKADIIYVDAAHEYEAVKSDIMRYKNLLKNGGCIFGDDYMEGWPGVVRAVDEVADELGLKKEINGVIWSLRCA